MEALYMVLSFPDLDIAGSIARVTKGALPFIGMKYEFQFRPSGVAGCEWMGDAGRILVSVTDVVGQDTMIEGECHVGCYRVELRPIHMTFRQFQELVRAPWFKDCGWETLPVPGLHF